MANANDNPTDGLGTAAAIILRGSGPVLTKVGSQVALSPGNRIGGHQYAVSLSVAGVGVVPIVYTTVNIRPEVVDISGLTFVSAIKNVNSQALTNKVKARVYESPANGLTGTEIVYLTTNNLGVASQDTFQLTAMNPGQCIVEFYFPAFDGQATLATQVTAASELLPNSVLSDNGAASDGDFIYSQVIVTVQP